MESPESKLTSLQNPVSDISQSSSLPTIPLRSFSLKSLRTFKPSQQLDVFRHAFLLPDTTTQSHSRNLNEDLELRRQTAVDTGPGGYPAWETLQGPVE